MARKVISPPRRDVFTAWPLVWARKPSGTRTTRSHLSGGTPPVGNSPRDGKSSGCQPSEGRKNASGTKLKPDSPTGVGWNSPDRCRVWRAETFHGRGKCREVFRGLSGDV